MGAFWGLFVASAFALLTPGGDVTLVFLLSMAGGLLLIAPAMFLLLRRQIATESESE